MTKSSLLPVSLITVGTLWLLKSADWFPDGADIAAFALAAVGVLLLLIDGFNKHTALASPLLLYAGAGVYANHHYAVPASPIIALGMIVAGCLMLLVRSDWIPAKKPSGKTPPPV